MILLVIPRELNKDFVTYVRQTLRYTIETISRCVTEKSLQMSLAMNEKFKFKETIMVEDVFKKLSERESIDTIYSAEYYILRINPNVRIENVPLDTLVRYISYGDLTTRPYPVLLELIHKLTKELS